MNTVLSCLRADARSWWYHKQLRQAGNEAEAARRERDSIRNGARRIRETLANGGWLSIGRGGTTLHTSPNSRVKGLHPGDLRACILAGVPTIDTRAMEFDDLFDLAVRGPMPGFAASTFGTNPDGSLSTIPWRTYFNRAAARGGAVFHNYTPTPEPWAPAHD